MEQRPTLFHFQRVGALWLAERRHALLADEMGLGKTAQAIQACEIIQASRVLVVCPASVCENWEREFQKFWPTFRTDSLELTVVSYDALARNLGRFKAAPYDVLICDEVHYLKNPVADRTRAVFGLQGVARICKRVWGLSGTPAPNHAAELWVLLVSFGLVKLSYEEFVLKYCESVVVHADRRQVTGTKLARIQEIRELIAPVILRRSKREVMSELPDLTFADIYVEPNQTALPPDVRVKYEAEWRMLSEKLGLGDFGSPETERELLLMLEGSAQSVSTLRRYTGVQKAQGVGLTIAEELTQGEYSKVILFAIHHEVIDILRRHFKNPAVITGKTPKGQRQKEVDRFQRDPECQAFIGNIGAAGTGITLTAADQVVFVEQDWVPGNNAQALMRAHRIGQTKNVTARFVNLKDSIDEKITQLLKRKSRELALLLNPEMQ